MSTDPALGEYIPATGKATAAEIGNLSGLGGAFNSVNLNLYHYANNNPVKYSDPDGNSVLGKVLGYGCYVAAGVILKGYHKSTVNKHPKIK